MEGYDYILRVDADTVLPQHFIDDKERLGDASEKVKRLENAFARSDRDEL